MKTLGFVFLFGIGGALIYLGGTIFSAGLADYQARTFQEDWQQKQTPPSIKAWRIAKEASEKAVARHPLTANGEYLDRLGRINEWLHFNKPVGDAVAQLTRSKAKSYYEQAIAARPAWPNTYSQLAYVKAMQGELDERFYEVAEAAYQLGPWRKPTLEQLAQVSTFMSESQQAEREWLVAVNDRIDAVKRQPQY
jgi:predicted Zn-dependent protease